MVNLTICRTPPSPRYLQHRHNKKNLARQLSSVQGDNNEKVEPELKPGQERLYSYCLPSLEAGSHTVVAAQNVIDGISNSSLKLEDTQKFDVIAPRYSLPEGSIHSVYPPPGHADNVEILPHVVFNDSHLPWERAAGKPPKEEGKKVEEEPKKNTVPWLAVLVFTQEELKITAEDLFDDTSRLQSFQPSTSLAVNLSLEELGSAKCRTPALNEKRVPWDEDDKRTRADFVFVPGPLFRSLVTDYEQSEKQEQEWSCISRYQFLAHTRSINTAGMANSGIDSDEGTFSVVMSHRTGPLAITKATQVVVHLVSIENVPRLPYDDFTGQRVALCSLDSWSYTCLPPNSLSTVDSMRRLGTTLGLLRPEPTVVDQIRQEDGWLANRLQDGYTITQYRTQTGEQTAALLRGPFAPVYVSHSPRPMSLFGTDLQVLDSRLGLMDITYSVAWEVGKALALADQRKSFSTSLGRIRLEITNTSLNSIKEAALRAENAFQNRNDTLANLSSSINLLRTLPTDQLRRGPIKRWQHGTASPCSFDFAMSSPVIRDHLYDHMGAVAERLSSSLTEDEIYNEHNDPLNTDWMVVMRWVLDRISLGSIPAHYLIADPSHLPPESLRFFHIDQNWVDSLIDGALSIANHIDRENDHIRTCIKERINEYLKLNLSTLPYPPQIPTYGFLIRSELCVKFPDLIVEAPDPSASGETKPATILHQENIAEGVLLVFFDRCPGEANFPRLYLRQPPHQQSFTVAATLDTKQIEMVYKQAYTTPLKAQPIGDKRAEPAAKKLYERGQTDIFVWDEEDIGVYTMRLPQWANNVHTTISEKLANSYKETEPTAALVGLQLNNPMHCLEIGLTNSPASQLRLAPCRDETERPGSLKMLRTRTYEQRAAMKNLISYASGSSSDSPDFLLCEADLRVSLPTPAESLKHAASRRGRHESQPPPHYRAIPVLQFPATEVLGGPGKSPHFVYKVLSLGRDIQNPDVRMLASQIPQDLVFSIRLEKAYSYELKELVIQIPLGSTDKTRETRKNYLTENYRGPGCAMLSNLRFNVIPSFRQNQASLLLAIRPRSVDGHVPLKLGDDLSFLLSGVVVNQYESTSGQLDVPLQVVERFVTAVVNVDPARTVIRLVE